jgi:anti-sigma B factor antagonist
MRLEFEIRDGVCVLRLKGRFVTGSNAEVASAKNQLRDTGIANAVVDLGEVPYIDSTGLAFLVELYKILQDRGGQLVLARPNARVREVLALTRIGEIIPVFDNQDGAVTALRAPQVLAGYAGR